MKTILFKGAAIFFILLVATSLLIDITNTSFGTVNFFKNHGLFFLIFITFFPRLTLLFSSVPFGGFLWWLGLIFCPRILVASLATVAYFHTNPFLVTMSWIVALGGETMEKAGLNRRRGKFIFKTYRSGPVNPFDPEPTTRQINRDDAIEAEFTKKS